MSDPASGRAPATGLLSEISKLGAFLRRDLLIALSYRWGFLSDAAGLIAQAFIFYFVNRIVDPAKLPVFDGARADYFGFVAVGIALFTVVQALMTGIALAVRREQMLGTLEPLLLTPTSALTLQLGSVAYDLAYAPLRTGAFLVLISAVFGVEIQASGWIPAIVILLALVPFVWGLGAASAAAVLTFQQVPGLLGLGIGALGVASGAYFPLDLFPAWIADLARYNPFAIALEGMRSALLGGSGWAAVWSAVAILVPVSAASLAAGSVAFHWALRRERRLGTLGLY
jgi:ABC-2 type transport system permease protein